MKKIRNLLMIAVLTALSSTLFAQSPPPPPGGHGETGNQDPRGAPIDGGLGILLALGATYGGYKIYKNRKDKAEKEVVD